MGVFAEDLFHRLRVVTVELPGLSERSEEFDSILHACLADVCAVTGREDPAPQCGSRRTSSNTTPGPAIYVSFATCSSTPFWRRKAAKSALRRSAPPGSARAKKAVRLLAAGQDSGALGTIEVPLTLDFQATIARFEREYLSRALRRGRGRINHTARSIGVNKNHLDSADAGLRIVSGASRTDVSLRRNCEEKLTAAAARICKFSDFRKLF